MGGNEERGGVSSPQLDLNNKRSSNVISCHSTWVTAKQNCAGMKCTVHVKRI